MDNDKIDLSKYLDAFKSRWYWLVICVVIIMGLSIAYCIVKMPQYESYASLLIEDDSDNSSRSMGGMASLMRTFSIGGFGKSSVDNELLILQSHGLKKNMVSRLKLNRIYLERQGLRKKLLYKNSPIEVSAPDALFDTLQVSLKMRVNLHDGKADIKVSKGLLTTLSEKKDVLLPCSIETPYGVFHVLKTNDYKDENKRTIDVILGGDDIVAGSFSNKVLSINYATKKADGITFEILDPSKERGRDILNTLMALYNERRCERKNERAIADVQFLDRRIMDLGMELSQSEAELEQFKLNNSFIDVETEAPVLLKQHVTVNEELLKLEVEKITLNSMLEKLNNPDSQYTLIPMSESMGDKNAATVIENYNSLILKRNSLLVSAKPGNVALKQITEQVDAMRESAIDNVKRLLAQHEIKYSEFKKESGKFQNRINSIPQIEREYVDLARDRELKNALYVFLLEKRESAMLKQNNNQELGFIYEPAYSAIKSYKTTIYIILGVSFVVALIFGLFFSIYMGLKSNKQ